MNLTKRLVLIFTLGIISCGVLDHFLGPGTEKKAKETLQTSIEFLPSPYRELASIVAYAFLREAAPHVHKKLKKRKEANSNGNNGNDGNKDPRQDART